MAGLSDGDWSVRDADFEVYWRACRTRLDAELARWIPKFFSGFSAAQIDTVHAIVADGKRIRGGLVCLVNDVLAGRIEDAIPRAVAIECIQAASLVHDDYVDDDTRRRNRPATWTIEGPRKAVLLGDVVFAIAIEKMMEISRADGLAVVKAVATMASGAYQEMLNPADAVRACADRTEFYHRIIHLKTGALFGAAAKLGALAAGVPSTVQTLAFEWGARLGEAYQIADDLDEILTVDVRDDKNLAAVISRLAALFPCFSPETRFDPAFLAAGREADVREWFTTTRPSLETRMRREIAHRLELTAQAAADFPAGSGTQLLHAAPSAIVRMNGASAPAAVPISAR